MSLFVTKITSIGAVEDGDNPESRIMLFKHNPDRDETIKEPNMADPTIEELQATIVEKDAEIAALTPELEVEVVVDPAIQKRLDDQASEIAKIQKVADDSAAELEKERQERTDAETEATASDYGDLFGDDAADVFKAVKETDQYDKFVETMDRVKAVLETADLFKELGVVDESDPVSQIEALAKEKQSDNPGLTIQQARVLARTERPDLKAAERDGA
jgi:hypothetical protein